MAFKVIVVYQGEVDEQVDSTWDTLEEEEWTRDQLLLGWQCRAWIESEAGDA